MTKIVSKIALLLSAFNLGAYSYAQTHGSPIEIYKWVITGAFFLLFLVLDITQKPNYR